ncbi:hypothetical protein DT603_09325 [Pseudoxanthomonas gei]|uniref:Uncharacterized protein n=1 Tax=Pseudoxanthomonas gei TaxID=1383030 RepID=A0ABX0AEX1_9GAMM|nr:hypothetical protein [Pseudoxanthomonas gei]
MSQNLISLTLSDAQLAAADQALTTLEEAFAGFIALEVSERRSLSRMGGKSEQFCRQTLTLLGDNPQIVPASIGVGDAQADLLALDRLRPRLVRLQKLAERAEDSETALGSDIMSLALEGYALLKVAGRSQGLEGARKDLANRFYKGPRKPEPPATP